MSLSSGYKILLDGYNVIKRNPVWSSMSLEKSRRELITRASTVRWPMPVKGIAVVFDAKAAEPSRQRPCEKVIVLFVPDADSEIQREIRAKHPRQPYLLISDDAELKATAKSHGVLAQNVSWFMRLGSGSGKRPSDAGMERGAEKVSAVAARKITQELADRWLRHEEK